MKKTFRILAFLFTVCAAAGAQVTPSATGPGSPQGTLPTGSNLQYALRYAQAGDFVSGVGNLMLATTSGSLDYMSGSERLPLNVDYSGGYTFSMTGPSYETGQFHRLFLSQGVVWRKWKVLVDDDASYLPEAPTTGFSGIPGIGEPIGVTSPAPVSGQSILTLNTHVIENIANGSLSHNLGSVTTISIGGSSALLRYPNGDGLDTTTESGTAGFVRNFNSRNALSANYLYSSFSYPGYSVTFASNTGMVGYQYKWSRSLSTNIGAGPQVITSSIPATVPSSTNVSVNSSINYTARFTSTSLSYTRGANGGAGYLIGADVDTVAGNFSRQFGLNLTIGLTGGYERTAGLNSNGATQGIFGGMQGVWRVGRDIIVFANYTGTDQMSTSSLPTNALNQVLQTIGFGIGFSPRAKLFRQ